MAFSTFGSVRLLASWSVTATYYSVSILLHKRGMESTHLISEESRDFLKRHVRRLGEVEIHHDDEDGVSEYED